MILHHRQGRLLSLASLKTVLHGLVLLKTALLQTTFVRTVFLGAIGTASVLGSDHADPLFLTQPESGIADLFVFPDHKTDDLVVALTMRPGLTDQKTVPLRPLTFRIHIDIDTRVSFADTPQHDRYGGLIRHPESISEDIVLSYKLHDDVTLASIQCQGIRPQQLSEPYTGIRDDPFIFHRFQSTNVVAIVQRIPWSAFPPETHHVLVWATTHRQGQQIDHVGRSLRTMQPRFDFLNTVHPSKHVSKLRSRHESPGVAADVLRKAIPPLFGLRHFDFEPDVLIYSKDRPAGYPNGRRLTDDVAKLCCLQGDCLLYEVSLAEADADHLPRPTENNVPFLETFPYLAAPNSGGSVPPDPMLTKRTIYILVLIGIAVVSFILLPWVLLWRLRRQHRRLKLVLGNG